MIPVTQRIVASGHDGKTPGDCVKCCVASILELPYEEVPHFVAGEVVNPNLVDGVPHPDGPYKMDWYSGLRWWMKERGFTCVAAHRSYFKDQDLMMAWRAELDMVGGYTPKDMLWSYDAREYPPHHEGFWVASVISENFKGTTHAIVMEGSTVAFDPSPHPRRTPYRYVGETLFLATDASKARRLHGWDVEYGWLIETKTSPCLWWTGTCWTADSNRALRFSRKIDGQNAMLAMKIPNAHVTDHAWPTDRRF